MYVTSTMDELWAMLLEKAFAKIYGDYDILRSGLSIMGMVYWHREQLCMRVYKYGYIDICLYLFRNI